MNNTTLTRTLDAPPSAVWEVLADFPNIADWNPTIKKSHSTSAAAEGVGATRHCDLAPFGSTEESVESWEHEKEMVVRVDDSSMLPFDDARMIFSLEANGDVTDVTMDFAFEPRGGMFSSLLGKRMEKKFAQQAPMLLDGLEEAARLVPQS